MQPLPPLPAGDMDAGGWVRGRLERVWGVLQMPPPMRLDMVLHFTRADRAMTFAHSLGLWEDAAAAVLAREAQVGDGSTGWGRSKGEFVRGVGVVVVGAGCAGVGGVRGSGRGYWAGLA